MVLVEEQIKEVLALPAGGAGTANQGYPGGPGSFGAPVDDTTTGGGGDTGWRSAFINGTWWSWWCWC